MSLLIIKKIISPTGADQRIVDVGKEVEVRGLNNEVKLKTRYFCVSGINAMFSGWEVLVFPCNEEGKVLDWGEVCGGRGTSHDEAIKELEEIYCNASDRSCSS